jgi:hypothetical protein
MESKFNFSEDDNLKNHSIDEKKPYGILGFMYSFLKETLDF